MKFNALEHFQASLLGPLPQLQAKHCLENLFTYQLSVSPKEIWPFVSDTSRMNKELGFSPRTEKEVNGETFVSAVTLGKKEEWIEKPWIWVDEHELINHRIFIKGWMQEHIGIFKVRATESGCEVSVYFKWSFSNIFKKIMFKVISKALEKNFAEYFRNKEEFIKSGRNKIQSPEYSLLEPASPYETFLKYLKTADELDLDRVQIKRVSQIVNLPSELLMDVSFTMVKDGLLSLSWDVICPHCRGAKSENSSLSYLEAINHCDACEIDFSIGNEESLEVVFHPTDKLRKISKAVYCAAEPARKKHIKLYQPVAAGKTGKYQIELTPGSYRLRTKGSEVSCYLRVLENCVENSVIWDGKTSTEIKSGRKTEIHFINNDEKDVFYTLEEAWWENERLSPGEVLSHHSLRTLFSEDHLKVGVKLNVGDQVIMFTDIVGSTPFYKELGDVLALKAVKEHYDEVQKIILDHHGVIVKYIGDAVMAAFLNLEDAMRASIELQKKFHPQRADTPIRLRASLHQGPILCANVNVGIDYFGNTVNQSAKIQKWADAFQIAMAESDWKILKDHFPGLTVKGPLYDEKLGLEVRVISVF